MKALMADGPQDKALLRLYRGSIKALMADGPQDALLDHRVIVASLEQVP
jgi:hypothetical protein